MAQNIGIPVHFREGGLKSRTNAVVGKRCYCATFVFKVPKKTVGKNTIARDDCITCLQDVILFRIQFTRHDHVLSSVAIYFQTNLLTCGCYGLSFASAQQINDINSSN
jgi:hypothetical protein